MPPLSLLIKPASGSCNMRCRYCFYIDETQNRTDSCAGRMNDKVMRSLIDKALTYAQGDCTFAFQGGEPTLVGVEFYHCFAAYADSHPRAKDVRVHYSIQTNGYNLNEDWAKWFAQRKVLVGISLDGPKEIHDRYRVDYAGNGSWDKIVPKFQRFVEKRCGKNYYMRGTFTHANPDFLKDIQTMLDLGFNELSMEPVVCEAGDPSELTEADFPIVCKQYEELAKLMLKRDKEGRPFTFYHYMIDLTGGPCIYKRISGCGSGTEYMAVTPWGDLYPCHQFVGDEKFKLGDIWHGVTNTEIQGEFAACNVYAHPECRDCWARLYCSGGCAANAYHATGKVTGIYEYGCRLFKKRMECAIMVAVDRALGE